jgi:nicotinamide mononucleotide adenylyltransferase
MLRNYITVCTDTQSRSTSEKNTGEYRTNILRRDYFIRDIQMHRALLLQLQNIKNNTCTGTYVFNSRHSVEKCSSNQNLKQDRQIDPGIFCHISEMNCCNGDV